MVPAETVRMLSRMRVWVRSDMRMPPGGALDSSRCARFTSAPRTVYDNRRREPMLPTITTRTGPPIVTGLSDQLLVLCFVSRASSVIPWFRRALRPPDMHDVDETRRYRADEHLDLVARAQRDVVGDADEPAGVGGAGHGA